MSDENGDDDREDHENSKQKPRGKKNGGRQRVWRP